MSSPGGSPTCTSVGSREYGFAGEPGWSGISFQTLAIASLSSLAAALVVHKVWGGGAIVGAAVTPVIVGIVGEALRHPVDKLAAPRDGGRRLPADREHDVPPASRERGDDPFGLWEAGPPAQLARAHLARARARRRASSASRSPRSS